VTYCTNSRSGEGNITVKIGGTSKTLAVKAPSGGGNSLRDLTFDFNGASGNASFEVECTTNSVYIHSIAITSGGGIAYTDYSTSCEACDKSVTISKGASEHGDFLLTREGKFETCGEQLIVRIVELAPESGYRFKEIVQTGISEGVSIDQESRTITYAKKSTGTSTISVVFEERTKNIIRFFADGSKVSEQLVEDGARPSIPEVSCSCPSHTFVGWSLYEVTATNEEVILENNFTATGDQDYYAIYSYGQETEGGTTAGVSFKKSDTEGNIDLTTSGNIYTIIGQENGISSCDGTKVYAGTGGAKIGSSKASGSIILTLTKDVTTKVIKVTAKKYGSDTGSLKVSAGGVDFGTAQPSGNESELTFTISSEAEIGKVTVQTTSKRAYISAITIGDGKTITTYYSSTINCSAPTAIEEIEEGEQTEVNGRKVMIDGQLYILHGDNIYTITGARIK
jgi:hypothetical protein